MSDSPKTAVIFGPLTESAISMVEEAEAGAGLVRVRIDGKFEVLSVAIDPLLLKEDKGMTEDLVRAAMNQAIVRMRDRLGEMVEREVRRGALREKESPSLSEVMTESLRRMGLRNEEIEEASEKLRIALHNEKKLCSFCNIHTSRKRNDCSACGSSICDCSDCLKTHRERCEVVNVFGT